jgi:hypothetical protein
MVFIYALQLEQGKYYIGKTNNPQFRIDSHYNSNGSAWTKKYKPLRLVELIPNCNEYDEDKYTRMYMDKYGINNVRGGSFVSVTLDKSIIGLLNQMSNGTNDKCFVCGKDGHFAKDCSKERHVVELPHHRLVKDQDGDSEGDSHEDSDEDSHEDSHEDSDEESEEEYDVWVCEYCDKEFMDEQKCEYHEKYCNSKKSKRIVHESDDGCFRCGREGHYASSCYASKHIKGYYLK